MKRNYTIEELTAQWNKLSYDAFSEFFIDGEIFRELACNSFSYLFKYDAYETIPKSVAELLIYMTDFAGYALIDMDTKGFNPQIMHTIISTMLMQFVHGFKKCGSEYPKLKLPEDLSAEYIDLETDSLFELDFIYAEPIF